jgi:hypothetical protein
VAADTVVAEIDAKEEVTVDVTDEAEDTAALAEAVLGAQLKAAVL